MSDFFAAAVRAPNACEATRQLASLGPVLLAVDPHHLQSSGWPPELPSDVLVGIELLDSEDAAQMCADPDVFPWSMVDPLGEVHLATVPWAAVVAVVGPLDRLGQPGQGPLIRLWPENCDPLRFGDDAMAEAALQAVLQNAGIGGTPEPDGEVEWSIQLSEQELSPDANRDAWCPDKREAFSRLVRQAPFAVLVLLRDHPGLELPGFPRQAVVQIPVGSQPPRLDYELGETGITRFIDQPPDHVGRGFVPWDAMGAMQNPRTREGWFWPADLPDPLKQGMAQAGTNQGDMWPRVQQLAGLPLAKTEQATAPARLLRFAPPPPTQKRNAFKIFLRKGPVLALAATRNAGWDVPEGWRSVPVAILAAGLADWSTPPQATPSHLCLTMPDDQGLPTELRVPWSAIFAVGSGIDEDALITWRDDLPREVVEAMGAIGELAEGHMPEAPSPHWHPAEGDMADLPAPFLGIGRTSDGQWVVTVLQPIGPADTEGNRPKIHAVFRLAGVTRLQ